VLISLGIIVPRETDRRTSKLGHRAHRLGTLSVSTLKRGTFGRSEEVGWNEAWWWRRGGRWC